MGYKITMSEIGPISLNETDPVKSILQNVSIILRTIKGSCPMYRGYLDRPPDSCGKGAAFLSNPRGH